MVDRYAGDEAWTQWFDRCAVDLCDEQWREPLWAQIESALGRAIAKKHIRNGRYSKEYIRNYFDTYFKLNADESQKDTTGKKKVRKLELMAEIPSAKDGLRGVVKKIMTGEVLSIAREIKVIVDEGESKWVVDAKGKKVLMVESFDEPIYNPEDGEETNKYEIIDIEKIVEPKCRWTSVIQRAPSIESDNAWFLSCAKRFIEESAKNECGGKNSSEKKIIVAAMLYVYMHKIPKQHPIVEKILGVKHVEAGKKVKKTVEKLAKYCQKNDIRVCDRMFVTILSSLLDRILIKHLRELQIASKV